MSQLFETAVEVAIWHADLAHRATHAPDDIASNSRDDLPIERVQASNAQAHIHALVGLLFSRRLQIRIEFFRPGRTEIVEQLPVCPNVVDDGLAIGILGSYSKVPLQGADRRHACYHGLHLKHICTLSTVGKCHAVKVASHSLPDDLLDGKRYPLLRGRHEGPGGDPFGAPVTPGRDAIINRFLGCLTRGECDHISRQGDGRAICRLHDHKTSGCGLGHIETHRCPESLAAPVLRPIRLDFMHEKHPLALCVDSLVHPDMSEHIWLSPVFGLVLRFAGCGLCHFIDLALEIERQIRERLPSKSLIAIDDFTPRVFKGLRRQRQQDLAVVCTASKGVFGVLCGRTFGVDIQSFSVPLQG